MKNFLGQNFLIDKEKIKKVVEALDLKTGETIIEIGAGHGEITLPLAKNFQFPISNFQITAIEKDKSLADGLKNKIYDLGLNKNIEIVRGDALKILPKLVSQLSNCLIGYKLIGNVPFYIAGRLLRIISELETKPEVVVFIIQKEVAQRICVKPPQMNLLAASVGFWAEPKIIGYISKKEFKPEPEVDAAIIKLANRFQPIANRGIAENYYKLITIIFKQPRKTILNNLIFNFQLSISNDGQKSLRKNEKNKEEIVKKLAKIGVNPQDRPQNLSVEQLIELSTLF